jgi:MFS family permease
MTATGVALSIVDSYALLLVVAFVGSVNPSGGSASSFVPVEHAVLTRETADAERTKAFARYGLVGGLASAGGALAAAMPELFTRPDWSELPGIKVMFWIYALLGLVGGLLYTRIPGRMPPTQHDWRKRSANLSFRCSRAPVSRHAYYEPARLPHAIRPNRRSCRRRAQAMPARRDRFARPRSGLR